jgi:hypothetical protein
VEGYDMTLYNPKIVLWQMNPHLLKAFFECKGYPLDIAWGEMDDALIQKISDAFLKLPDSVQQDIESDLQDVHTIAITEGGISLLIEQAIFMGFDIAGELEQFDSRYDKTMWVLLHHADIWEKAAVLAHAENLHKQFWFRRCHLPKKSPDTSESAMASLKREVSAFFWRTQGRGKICHIDTFRRNAAQDYFFVYLSDHTDTDITLDPEGHFQRIRNRHAFEIVFVFDRSEGTMDVFAQGGTKIVETLQNIFARIILGIKLEPDNTTIPYRIDRLKERSFSFATDPEDGVVQVAVQKLRLSPMGNPKKKISVKLPVEGNLNNDLDNTNVLIEVMNVEEATLSLKLEKCGRRKTLTFDIGPNACNLKSQPEPLRTVGEKYLRRWGIAPTA